MESLNNFQSLLWIFAGVLLSILVPVAAKTVKEGVIEVQNDSTKQDKIKKLYKLLGSFLNYIKPYIQLGLASLVISFLTFVVVRYTGGSFKNWTEALMTGYFWDSTLQKIKEGSRGNLQNE